MPHRRSRDELPGDLERIDGGIHLRGRRLHLRQRFHGERERRRHGHAVPEREVEHVLEHHAQLDVLDRRAAHTTHEELQIVGECRHVEIAAVGRMRERQDRVGEQSGVLLPEGHQQQDEDLARLGADLADHAKVEEIQPLLGRLPHQVARMRIGVEEPIYEDLLIK